MNENEPRERYKGYMTLFRTDDRRLTWTYPQLSMFNGEPFKGLVVRRGVDGRAVFTEYPSGEVLTRQDGMERIGAVDANDGDNA